MNPLENPWVEAGLLAGLPVMLVPGRSGGLDEKDIRDLAEVTGEDLVMTAAELFCEQTAARDVLAELTADLVAVAVGMEPMRAVAAVSEVLRRHGVEREKAERVAAWLLVEKAREA